MDRSLGIKNLAIILCRQYGKKTMLTLPCAFLVVSEVVWFVWWSHVFFLWVGGRHNQRVSWCRLAKGLVEIVFDCLDLAVLKTEEPNLWVVSETRKPARQDKPHTVSSDPPIFPNNTGSDNDAVIPFMTLSSHTPSQFHSPGFRVAVSPSGKALYPRWVLHACQAPGFPAASRGIESSTLTSSNAVRM